MPNSCRSSPNNSYRCGLNGRSHARSHGDVLARDIRAGATHRPRRRKPMCCRPRWSPLSARCRGIAASASMATPSSKPSTMSLSKITFSRADTERDGYCQNNVPQPVPSSHAVLPPPEGVKNSTAFRSGWDKTPFRTPSAICRENVVVPVFFPADALAAPRASRMADERP